jgi:glucose-6-phosphate isomerase
MNQNNPFTFTIPSPNIVPTRIDKHIKRYLSDLKGQFQDSLAFESKLSQHDQIIYEVYEIHRPEEAGELLCGISVVHPGKIGKEFFMTKGHFHTILNTAEIYYVLKGEGFMVMETPEGNSAVESLSPGKVLYIPPRWAHRSVCTSRIDDLVTFFVYPGNAGHDYGTIEEKGFQKLIIENEKGIEIIDNPRWNKE